MNIIAGIDPGNKASAYVLYDIDTRRVVKAEKLDNEALREKIRNSYSEACAIEMVQSFGMAVGREVFETVFWIGRFFEARLYLQPESPAIRVYRSEVKMHLCHSTRAKDANIRTALIDRFGDDEKTAIGRKACPGPLYGMAGDLWSALAVAITAADTKPGVRVELIAAKGSEA